MILPSTLAVRLSAAAALLWLERAWPRLRGIAVGLVLAVAAALLGLTEQMSAAVRVALVGVALVGGLVYAALVVGQTAWPSRMATLGWMERRAGVSAGSARLAFDRDLTSHAGPLWQRAFAEAVVQARRLPLPMPVLDCVQGDRFGLAPLAVLLLALGLFVAGPQASDRLGRAVSPYVESLAGVTISVVVQPPAYVQRPAQLLSISPGGRTAVNGLDGAHLTLTAAPLTGVIRLLDPDGKVRDEEDATAAQGVRARLDKAGDWRLVRGWRTLATLAVTLAADQSPAVAFVRPPQRTTSGALRVDYRLLDDFGAATLALQLEYQGERRRFELEAPISSGEGGAFIDLTPDPWAGKQVLARLVATDGAGQEGFSPPLALQVPQRSFTQPFARRIMAARQDLLDGGPVMRVITQRRLDGMARDTKAYDGHLTVFAALRAAHWRLVHDRDDARGWSTARLLWDVAVAVEGDRGQSLTDLRDRFTELTQMLNGAPSDADLARMTEALARSMAQYLAEQTMRAMRNPASGAQRAGGQTLSLDSLDQLLEELRTRLAAGDKAGARALLEQLRAVMEQVQFSAGAQGAGSEALASAQAATKAALAAQQDLHQRTATEAVHQALSDQTGQPSAGLRAVAAAQKDLAAQLAGAQEELASRGGGEGGGGQGGTTPDPGAQALATARTAMRQAAAQLGAGNAVGALQAQNRALEALQQASQALTAALNQSQRAGGQTLDPLGRVSGAGLGRESPLPSAAQVQALEQVRRLLEERAGDARRPQAERAYYLRLLKRF